MSIQQIPKKIINYVIESKRELQKVVWPTKKETTKYTMLVIGISIAVATFFGIIDFFFSLGLENLLSILK
ncbi:MAG: preprotein translocase subunit SecE [Patescibacteria group bacterium]|nr:preprotein translocase subunit SecE [Patescibacteria group bacterium]